MRIVIKWHFFFYCGGDKKNEVYMNLLLENVQTVHEFEQSCKTLQQLYCSYIFEVLLYLLEKYYSTPVLV